MDHTQAENPRVITVALAVNLARHSAGNWSNPAIPDDLKNIQEFLHISHESLLHKLGIDAVDIPCPDEPKSDPQAPDTNE